MRERPALRTTTKLSSRPELSRTLRKRSGETCIALCAMVTLFLLPPAHASAKATPHSKPTAGINGVHVLELTQQLLAVAPKRFAGSPGHAAAEAFIKAHFALEIAHGQFETDSFTPTTPIGAVPMRNYIVRYPGKKDGVIVLVTHYETNYPLKDINFVGANDGACTTALLIALGEHFRAHPPEGYAVWLVFDDGEEAIKQWTASDSLYGTRHLAAKWSGDGTLKKVKAVLIADMLGDKDLNIDHVDNSTPWLLDTLKVAANNTGHSSSIFKYNEAEEDDHLPFAMRGVPVLDLLDAHYGPITNALPDGFHHTAHDTFDKLSAHSLQISADLFLEMIKLIDQR
ncbi:MAG: M28 family peptidase [Acidobacteriaceae bacterium]